MATATSEHYEFQCPDIAKCDAPLADVVISSVGSAQAGTVLLEAAYKNYTAFFGAQPKLKKDEKLRVRLHATDAEWREALKKEDAGAPEAGGFYWPPAKSASLFIQPSALYTRTLLLHEAMHQFHLIARANNNHIEPAWYVEGLAEYVARHTWDGKTLKNCALQPLSLEEYWAKASERVSAKDFSLAKLADTGTGEDRPVWMALVAYLCEADGGKLRKKFDALGKQFESGNHAGGLFRTHIGDPAAMQPEFVKWVASHQEPWTQVWNEWEGTGEGTFFGHAGVVSACRFKADAKEITATLVIPKRDDMLAKPDGNWRGGLLLGYSGGEEYTVALINQIGRIVIQRRHDGKWDTLYDDNPPPKEAENTYVFRAMRKDGKVRLSVDGRDIGEWAVEGAKFGLALDNCKLNFSDVKVTPAEAAKDGKPAKPAKAEKTDKSADKSKTPAEKTAKTGKTA
jgi:hypothetical protein